MIQKIGTKFEWEGKQIRVIHREFHMAEMVPKLGFQEGYFKLFQGMFGTWLSFYNGNSENNVPGVVEGVT